MGPMGPRGLGPIKKNGRTDRVEGRTGRTNRVEGPGGRTDRADGRTGWTEPPTPHPPPPKNHENQMFLRTLKRCASKFCEGSTQRELQIIDMALLGANSVFEKV